MTLKYPNVNPPNPLFLQNFTDANRVTTAWQEWLKAMYGSSRVIINEWGTETDKSGFEADGTLVMTGNATTWQDINVPLVSGKVPAANAPTLANLVGNLKAYQFAVNDYLDLPSIELLHDWKEGSSIQFHVHWAPGGANDATPRGVKWEIEYAIANFDSDGGDTVFTSVTATQAADTVIPASDPAATHHKSVVATVDMTGYKIGAAILFRIKRVASTGTAPAANPFGLQLGIHYERDTLGSRGMTTK